MIQMDYSEILKNVQEDPNILSQINISELLAGLDTVSPYFENKQMADISQDILDVISEISHLSLPEKEKMFKCLKEYYHIGQIYQFQKGRYIRWLRKNSENPKLTNGGIVMEIIFRESGGTYILCITNQKKLCQLRFDDCFFFQKMTVEEQIVLAATEYCHTV